MKPSISRSWRFNKLCKILASDVVKGILQNQNYSVTGINWHIGVTLFCKKCNDTFVFSAKEQQHWYETLKFWADSVPIECQDCRGVTRSIVILNKRLSKVLVVNSMQINDYIEIVDIASGLISNGVAIGGKLAQKIRMAAKKLNSVDAKKLLIKLQTI